MDSKFSQIHNVHPVTINTINNQIINMYPSQSPDPDPHEFSKRKRTSSSPPPIYRHRATDTSASEIDPFPTPEFQVVNGIDTYGAKSKLEAHIIRDWRQLYTTWAERARCWRQQEKQWYNNMYELYDNWRKDPNFDRDKHPYELTWAFMKLDQAMREVLYCKEWIAYAKWQVVSRMETGKMEIEECPPLPPVDGRPLMLDKDKIYTPVGRKETESESIKSRGENGDLTGYLSKKTPAQSSVQASQALTQASLRELSKEYQRRPLSQSSWGSTSDQAPIKASISAPVKLFSAANEDPQSPPGLRIKALQTPTQQSTKALTQYPIETPPQVFTQPLSRAPIQVLAPVQRTCTQSFARPPRDPVENAAQTPIRISSQEFLAQKMMRRGQQQDGQLHVAKKPIHYQKPDQQSMPQASHEVAPGSTPKINQGLIQKHVQKSTQQPTQRASQRLTQDTQQHAKNHTQKPTQDFIQSPISRSAVQLTNIYGNPIVHNEVSAHKNINTTAGSRRDSGSPRADPTSQNPISSSPSTPTVAPVAPVSGLAELTETNSGTPALSYDWWDTWIIDPELDTTLDIQGEELEKLMDDFSSQDRAE